MKLLRLRLVNKLRTNFMRPTESPFDAAGVGAEDDGQGDAVEALTCAIERR